MTTKIKLFEGILKLHENLHTCVIFYALQLLSLQTLIENYVI